MGKTPSRTFSSYADAVATAAEKKSLTAEKLRLLLMSAGWEKSEAPDRSTVQRWCSGELAIPRYAVSFLAKALELDVRTAEEVEAKYSDHVWPQPRRRNPRMTTIPATAVSGMITHIHALHARSRADSEEAAATTRKLLGSLDHRHYFISTTTAIRNYLWEKGDPYGMVPGRAESISRNALFVMLVPTKSCFRRISRHIHFQPQLGDYEDIIRGIETYKRNTVNHLRKVLKVRDALAVFDASFQCVPCEEFPFTGAGWTVSLLGETTDAKQMARYALIHGPYASGLSLALWDEPDHFFPLWLEGWMKGIVSEQFRTARDRLKRDFFRRLADRMDGRHS